MLIPVSQQNKNFVDLEGGKTCVLRLMVLIALIL